MFAIKAERNHAEAEAVSEFLLNDVFENIGNFDAAASDYSYILEKAIQKLDTGKLENRPLIEAQIRGAMGWGYLRGRRFEPALEQFERAYRTYRAELGPEDKMTIRARAQIAWAYRHWGRADKAEPLATELLALATSVYGEEHRLTTELMNLLANIYQSQQKAEKAGPIFRKILAINERVYGDRHHQLWASLNFAYALWGLGKYEESEALFLEALEIARQRWGPGNKDTLNYIQGLAKVYRGQGKLSEAESTLSSILRARPRVFERKDDPDAPLILETMRLLAAVRIDRGGEGDYERAEEMLLQALRESRDRFGDRHQDTLETLRNLIELYDITGRPDQADKLRAELPQTDSEEP
jgi:tetratricopeptide (TPR) repeat protein